MENVKAIFFDFDNTLGNRFDYAYRTHKQFVLEFLPEIKDELLIEAMTQDLLTFDGMGNINVAYVLDLFEKKYNLSIRVENYNDWWHQNQYKNTVLNKDVVSTLAELRKRYKLGIITNGNSLAQNGKIEKSGIRKMFETVVISDDVGSRKPEARIFEIAADRIGFKAEECLYVGDTFSNDIYGAVRAGMKAIWIWPNELRPLEADIIRIREFRELLRYL